IEDTGLSDHLPTGEGLLVFRDMAEAVAGVEEIDRNYARHHRARAGRGRIGLSPVSPRDVGRLRLLGVRRRDARSTGLGIGRTTARTTYPELGVIKYLPRLTYSGRRARM